ADDAQVGCPRLGHASTLPVAASGSGRVLWAPPSALYALKDSPVPCGHNAHSQSSHVQTCFRTSASTSRSCRRRSSSSSNANTVGGSKSRFSAAFTLGSPFLLAGTW